MAAVYGGLVHWVHGLFPSDADPYAPLGQGMRFLLCDLLLMVCFLLFAGTLYLAVWDQRYRCRTCLRRLRMPVETGSRSNPLRGGIPNVEYICIYGHGTLVEEESRMPGLRRGKWKAHSGDIWAELCASSRDSKDL